jgi:hypothetical protein
MNEGNTESRLVKTLSRSQTNQHRLSYWGKSTWVYDSETERLNMKWTIKLSPRPKQIFLATVEDQNDMGHYAVLFLQLLEGR